MIQLRFVKAAGEGGRGKGIFVIFATLGEIFEHTWRYIQTHLEIHSNTLGEIFELTNGDFLKIPILGRKKEELYQLNETKKTPTLINKINFP